MYPRFRVHPLTLSLALTFPTWTQAQSQATDAPHTLSTVTVNANADASAEGLSVPYAGGQVARGGRIGILGNQDIMETPFSVTNYTHDLIQDQQARSVGDVLLNDASVRSTRGFGNFQQAYFMRGFIVYSDDVAYNGLYGLVPRQYMASEFIERVEAFRGANTFLSGAGLGSTSGSGLGGLINIVPKRAPQDPLSQVTVGVQSGGEGYAAADIARRFGPDNATGIRLNLAHRDGNGAVDRESSKLDAVAVGLDWHSRNVRLSADVGYQDSQLNQPRPSVTPGSSLPIPSAPSASGNFAQPWTYSNARDTFATVRGEVDLNDQVTAWAAYGGRNSNERNSLANPTLADAAGNTTAYRFDNARKDHINTGEVGVRGKFRTDTVSHTVVASVGMFEQSSRNAYAYSWPPTSGPNLYNPSFSSAPTASISGGSLDAPQVTERVRTSSFAVADTLGFAQDKVLLTLGARHQSIEDTTYDYTTGIVNASSADGSNPYKQSRTSPMAGVVYKLDPKTSLYANYIEGLTKGDTVAPVPNTGPSVVFAPYVSKQKEVGVKYDAGKLGASAAFFTTTKPWAYAATGLPPGVYGEQRNQGLEFNVFGETRPGLRLLGGLTLLDATLRNTDTPANNGNTAIGVPREQLNLGADWNVPGVQGLALNGRVIQTGKQYADAANTQSIPSWSRTDLGVRYLMDIGGNRTMTLRARVENVFNKSYWASAGGYPGYGYLTVGAPRTLVLTSTVDF